MRLAYATACVGLLAAMVAAGAAAAQQVVTIGVVPSLPAASTYLAIEKGYFKAAGIEAKLETINSAAKVIPFLASGQMQVVEGGLSVGYFNGVAQGLPITIALDRGTSPLYHNYVLRPGLKNSIKQIADMKGHSIATAGPGSVGLYEIGKVLESAGLKLKDVDVKFIPFPGMGAALANGAIDVAATVPPFGSLIVDKGLGVAWLDPDDVVRPTMSFVSYLVNTEWAAKNHDLAHALFLALAKAGREYCQAYHHGPNRAEVEDVVVKYGGVTDRVLLARMPWQARDPNGRVSIESLVDIQDWFVKEGMIERKLPLEKLVDTSYADEAAKALGPFELVNKSSELKGCR